MGRKSLLVVLLLAVASPLAAQDAAVWSSGRPDALAPLGIPTAQMLEPGQFQFTYRLNQLTSKGIWYQSDSLSYDDTRTLYPVVPISMRNLTHEVSLAVAATRDLTLLATLGYSQRRREQILGDSLRYFTDTNELGDLELTALYNVVRDGPYRAHLQLGAIAPTGSYDPRVAMPTGTGAGSVSYDLRPGTGVFSVVPGGTFAAQNDFATVGASFEAVIRVGSNKLDYTPGNRFEGSVWAAYRVNEYVSVTARAHYVSWGSMSGVDGDLDPAADPGNETFWGAGRRVDMPLGLTVLLPEGSRFGGNRLSLEWITPISQHYDWLQLGADWGLVAGWQVTF